jgi:hypothetical protein
LQRWHIVQPAGATPWHFEHSPHNAGSGTTADSRNRINSDVFELFKALPFLLES